MKNTIITWLVLIFAAVGIAGCSGGENAAVKLSADDPEAANAAELNFFASNWQFDQKEYRIKEGEPIKLLLTNEEGTHKAIITGLGVDLAGDKSVIIKPIKAGTYDVICSKPCGTGHSKMRAKLIVE